jgi:hypothetical protein
VVAAFFLALEGCAPYSPIRFGYAPALAHLSSRSLDTPSGLRQLVPQTFRKLPSWQMCGTRAVASLLIHDRPLIGAARMRGRAA